MSVESIQRSGQTLSHFRVLEEIGRGGMGIVYRAEDTLLRRKVALKILPTELMSDDKRRGRFLREARSLAAVAHSNIATVYEVGEESDTVFIAILVAPLQLACASTASASTAAQVISSPRARWSFSGGRSRRWSARPAASWGTSTAAS